MVLLSRGGKFIMDGDIFNIHRTLVQACGVEPKVPQKNGTVSPPSWKSHLQRRMRVFVLLAHGRMVRD